MKKIIMDTNFLMIPWMFKVDIFSEFERISNFKYNLFIFDSTIEELNNIIKKQRGKNKKAAQFALKLINSKHLNIISSLKKNVDSLILENLSEDDVIATLDAKLKKEVLEKGNPVVILRQKKYLQIIERKGL